MRFLVLVCLLFPFGAFAALDAEMRIFIDGNQIAGPSEQFQGGFEVNEIHHLIDTVEFRSGSEPGVVRGLPSHQEFIVVTELGTGSVALLRALGDQTVAEVMIKLYRPAQTGEEVHYYTIELLNARLAAYETIMPDNRLPANLPLPVYLRLRFRYETIRHTDVVANEEVELNNQ